MFKAERIQRIKEIIFERKQIDVATLSSLLNVTEVTIRNDLEQLEKSGFLTRNHGGATLNASAFPEEQLHTDRMDGLNIPYDKEKEELGLVASQLVREREWIFLGPGTTSYYIAKALSKRQNLNIMTNNFYVANVFGSNASVQLLFLGGRMQNSGMYTSTRGFKPGAGAYLFKQVFLFRGWSQHGRRLYSYGRECGRYHKGCVRPLP
jgi:DeoR/GlpR family transcriptional regulator of sugar metabolism